MPDDCEMVYPIHKIKVPRHMLNSNFSLIKFATFGDYFVKNGTVDTAITVKQDKYNKSKIVLQDGYIRYNVLKVNNVKYIPVKFIA